MASVKGDDTTRVQQAIEEIAVEVLWAMAKHGPLHSPHEGYGVLMEEVDELLEAIRRNDPVRVREEAIQVAAMGAWIVVDLGG